jgi:hypothetical protein
MRVLLVIALCASSMSCARQDPAGPAWPKSAERESDGGESLTPRAAARAIAAAVEEHAVDRAADKPATPATAAAAVTERPASGGQVQMTEEPLSLDEIIIEVDD